jgi:hypothetical protein
MFRAATVSVGIIVCLWGCSRPAPQYGPNYALSDDDIAAYARRAGEKSFRGPDGVIGIHQGTKVVSDFHFFDDGEMTVIIHYDVQPGQACKRVGGAERIELVPVAITAVETSFCVPNVLVDRHLQITPAR